MFLCYVGVCWIATLGAQDRTVQTLGWNHGALRVADIATKAAFFTVVDACDLYFKS